MKKWIIALVITLAVGVGAATGVAIYNNQPEVVVRNAILGAMEDLCERDEISPVMNMLEKGSLEVKADADMKVLGAAIGIDSIKAGGKLYFSKDAFMLDNLNVKAGKLDLSADAYIGEDLIYVSNEEILGGSWGVIRGEMASALEDSMFIDWYKLDDNTKEALEKVLDSYDEGRDKELKKDLEKYIKKYMKTVVLAIEKNADYDVDDGRVKIGGEKVDARIIEVTIDADAIVGILEAVYDELKDDDKLRDTVVEYLEDYEDMLRESGAIAEDEDVKDFYKDLIRDFGEFIDYMDDSADDSEGSFIFEVVTPKMSSKLMQISVINDNGEDKNTLFTLDIGEKGIKKSEQISLIFTDHVTYTYKIKENNSKEYSAELKADRGDDQTETLFKVSVDKKDDSFKLVIDNVTLSGDFIVKGKTTTITLNKIRAGEVTVKDIELTIIIKEKDKMPKPLDKKKVNNILEITEDDIKEIAENAENLDFDLGGFNDGESAPDYNGSTNRPGYPGYEEPDYSGSENGAVVKPDYDFGGSDGNAAAEPEDAFDNDYGFIANPGASYGDDTTVPEVEAVPDFGRR